MKSAQILMLAKSAVAGFVLATSTMASAESLNLSGAVQSGNGHAVLVILDATDAEGLMRIRDDLSDVAGQVRVGVGAYGPDTDEGRSERESVLQAFQAAGFQTCPSWGTVVYDPAVAEDVYDQWMVRLRNSFDVAHSAALIVDNGPVTTAGAEWGQDYLMPGVGTGDDRLFVRLADASAATEVRDDQAFAVMDFLVDTEVPDIDVWDCMKGR